jgi:elongation of very long chain fatty acids protein 6
MEWCGSFVNATRIGTHESIWKYNKLSYDPVKDVYSSVDCNKVQQLFQDLPFLKSLYPFEWERSINVMPFITIAERHFDVAVYICLAYLVLVFGGQYLMKNVKEFNLKNSLAMWNLFLAVFSLIGFIRTAPHLLYYLYKDGLYVSSCYPAEPRYGQGAAGLWTMLFIYSKIPELFDTLFIVLRKKQLIFLHWYHHITVLLYCWHSYMTRASVGFYFCSMNYGVHAIMYYYYYLQARGIKVSWAKIVTTLQISQMAVGVSLCLLVAYYRFILEKPCDITNENFISAIIMYGSYLFLFLSFAFDRYVLGGKSIERILVGSRPSTADSKDEKKKSKKLE